MVDYPAEKTGLMTIDEFVRLYDTEGPFEIINGERIPKMPSVSTHTYVTRTVFRALDRHVVSNKLDEVFSEGTFILLDRPNWVRGSRIPDVMFCSAARISEFQSETPDWGVKPFVLVPNLVVEVVSPNDSYTDLDAKVDLYLEDGVEMVWVVDPQQKTVMLRGRDFYKKLHINDTLTGGDIIPGFEMPVKAIFE